MRHLRIWIVIVLAGLYNVGAVLAQGAGVPDTTALRVEIDSIMHAAIAARAFPGGQVVVFYKGDLLLHRWYGFHTYDSIRSTRPDDIYDLASITKVTSVLPAVMKLAGEGRFDLDATISDYFPEFSKTNKSDLVWRDVLAHNARLQPWIPYWRSTVKKSGKYKARTFKYKQSNRFPVEITDSLYLHRKYKKKIYKAIAKSPLNEEPGYVYSGLSFYILPEIIERITGQPLEDYLREEIYDPIGATTLGYNPMRFYDRDRIVPTERDTFFRMTQIHGRVHDEGAVMMGGISGNAGLFATPLDLGKMAMLYYNRGIWKGDTILPPDIVDEFSRCQFCDEGNRRGLGFDKSPWLTDPEATSRTISQMASPESYGHSGIHGHIDVDRSYL